MLELINSLMLQLFCIYLQMFCLRQSGNIKIIAASLLSALSRTAVNNNFAYACVPKFYVIFFLIVIAVHCARNMSLIRQVLLRRAAPAMQ